MSTVVLRLFGPGNMVIVSTQCICQSQFHFLLFIWSHRIPGIRRATSLGVTVTNKLSISDHVSNVIRACAQSLHAVRVLRCHGMCNSALQTIYRAVIISKLFYASSAWWGFSTATDRQRFSAFLRRGVRAGLYGADDSSVTQIVDDADNKLFLDVLSNPQHTLHHLLPKQITHKHQLRTRRHDRRLLCK